jgi:hypothetical protein
VSHPFTEGDIATALRNIRDCRDELERAVLAQDHRAYAKAITRATALAHEVEIELRAVVALERKAG